MKRVVKPMQHRQWHFRAACGRCSIPARSASHLRANFQFLAGFPCVGLKQSLVVSEFSFATIARADCLAQGPLQHFLAPAGARLSPSKQQTAAALRSIKVAMGSPARDVAPSPLCLTGEETPPPPSGSEGFALVAAEREDLLATQAEAPDYLNALDALEADAIRENAALKEKVSSATDPCQGAREQLQDLARQAWKMAFHADFDFDASELGEKAQQLKPEDLERFHNAWAKLVYDVKEVYQAIGFHRRQDNVSLRSFVTSLLGFLLRLA